MSQSSTRINRSEEIRKYFADHPNAKTAEVVRSLGKRHINVSVGLVTNVASTERKKARAATAAKRAANDAVLAAEKNQALAKKNWAAQALDEEASKKMSVSDLYNLKKFVNNFGGLERVKNGLEYLTLFTK